MVRPSGSARKMVGARELKTRLGRYLRAVRNGTTITVTERGVPVARLSPLPLDEGDGIDAALSELEAAGVLSRASGAILDDGRPMKLKGEAIESTLARERDDRV